MPTQRWAIDHIRCPYCGEQTYIKEYGRELVSSAVYAISQAQNGRFYIEAESQDSYDYELENYSCAHCGETLADDQEELIALLQRLGVMPGNVVNSVQEIN